MSARDWELGALVNRWFRPRVYAHELKTREAQLEYRQLHGDDIRSDSEDLDPHVRFEYWYSRSSGERVGSMNKTVTVKVGLDPQDAVDEGKVLHLPLSIFWNRGPYKERFERMGFDPELADELTDDGA